MISKWHINIYWYSIAVMALFLIFLLIPDSIDTSNAKNYDKQVQALADKNLKAETAIERASISRKLNLLEKNKSSNRQSSILNLLPFKIILLIIMSLFVYLILQRIWTRRRPKHVTEET